MPQSACKQCGYVFYSKAILAGYTMSGVLCQNCVQLNNAVLNYGKAARTASGVVAQQQKWRTQYAKQMYSMFNQVYQNMNQVPWDTSSVDAEFERIKKAALEVTITPAGDYEELLVLTLKTLEFEVLEILYEIVEGTITQSQIFSYAGMRRNTSNGAVPNNTEIFVIQEYVRASKLEAQRLKDAEELKLKLRSYRNMDWI